MSIGYKKPTDNELQQDLYSLIEIPERIKEFKEIRLKEVLIFLNNRINRILKTIDEMLIVNDDQYNYPPEYLQENNQFKYWAERISQFGHNYYGLLEQKQVIENYLNIKSLNNPDSTTSIFKKDRNGLLIFNFLKDNFPHNLGVTSKYTVIYYYLLPKLNTTIQGYRKFVKEYCSEELNGTKFSRLAIAPSKNEEIIEKIERSVNHFLTTQ